MLFEILLICVECIYQDDNIPIGTVRRCCFCCALLADFLALGTKEQHFKISGSFTTIFPWVAPYGVPGEVLHKVRDALFHILNQKVRVAKTPS